MNELNDHVTVIRAMTEVVRTSLPPLVQRKLTTSQPSVEEIAKVAGDYYEAQTATAKTQAERGSR